MLMSHHSDSRYFAPPAVRLGAYACVCMCVVDVPVHVKYFVLWSFEGVRGGVRCGELVWVATAWCLFAEGEVGLLSCYHTYSKRTYFKRDRCFGFDVLGRWAYGTACEQRAEYVLSRACV